MGYFLGLIKCPKVGGPEKLAAHKDKKSGRAAARPVQ